MHSRHAAIWLAIAVLLCPALTRSQENHAASADQPCSQLKYASTPRQVALPEDQAAKLLLHKEKIKYPGVAKAARISGTVIVQATITGTGDISNVRPLCGPAVLEEAVVKAVRKWKYRPYLINGEPVELETTITSVFRLGK